VITSRKRGVANTLGIEASIGVTVDKVYVLPKYQNIYAGGADKILLFIHGNRVSQSNGRH